MTRSIIRPTLIAIVFGATVLGACGGTLERAAAKDPQKCERDPNCPRKNRGLDCSTQCADDPACVDRCNEVQINAGTTGR